MSLAGNDLRRFGKPADMERPDQVNEFCRMADVKSAAQVALEAGNSPQMIFEHYRELVTEKEAKAWFAITPAAVKPIREKEEQDRAERERQEAAKIVHFPVTASA